MTSKGIGEYIPGGRNVEAYRYVHSEDYPPLPDRAKFIGVLTGTWYQMGVDLGQRSEDLTRYTCEIWWEEECEKFGKTETLKAAKLYEAAIADLDPNQIDFMHGIADGAASWLNQSLHADPSQPLYATNYERVVAINAHFDWVMYHPRQFPDGSSTYGGSVPSPPKEEICLCDDSVHHCNSFSIRGRATTHGEVIAANNTQSPYDPSGYQVVYIIKPPNGNTALVRTNPPYVGRLFSANDKGVSVAMHTGSKSAWYQGKFICTEAFGVPLPTNLALYVVTHASTAKEAIEIITLGTPEYRARTGRNSLLRARGGNWLITDKNTMAVVEVAANRYAVRYPGEYTGPEWTDTDYIVTANHELCPFSYDEHNNLTNVPMTAFADGYNHDPVSGEITGLNNSGIRFWTLMWDIKHNYGHIDKYRAQQICSGLYGYDKDTGERIDCAERDGKWHLYGEVEACAVGTSAGLLQGTNESSVAILDGLASEVNWTLGSPCHWQGAWDQYYFRKHGIK